MAFDLGEIMARKQERECARLDDFAFRWKARTVRQVAEWVRPRSGAAWDSASWSRQIAVAPLDAVLAGLRAKLDQPIADATWNEVVTSASTAAHRALITEYGDPTPVRLG